MKVKKLNVLRRMSVLISLIVGAFALSACGGGDDDDELENDKPGSGNYGSHEYVDLGLPSGLKWATCNVGAAKPEEYGDYFAWGETEPKETCLECPLRT